ncbi:MAG: GIY-YIG nuclease family protein [Flavobacteriales bacterium]|nr:GIY-YIG nuclease family protein [Flavobacteriales bacterium]MCB9261857.1 GIY-YIG nuclease family protein [Flavobacteriales bacterium]
MYSLYILHSDKLNGYYIGYTSLSVEERLYKHLHSKKGHTAKATDWKVVYVETYPTKQEAMQREKQLKAWKSKTRIIELIFRSSTD